MRRASFVFVFLLSSIAAAAEPNAADRESARAYMAEGRQKRDAGDFKAALRAFEAADAIMHVPTTAFEIAKTQSMMSLLVEARDEALRIARTPITPNEPAPFAEARTAAQKLADDLESRVPSIRVTLKAGPDSATVTIDDVALPAVAVGLPRKLDPGMHTVVAKSGALERRVSVQVLEREAKEIPIDLAEPQAPTTVTPITTTPTTPVAATRKGPWLTLGIISLGVGVAGLATGSVAGLMSISDTSTLKNQCPNNSCPPTLNGGVTASSALTEARNLATISDVGFIAGGVLAAVGLTFIVLAATKKSATTVTVGGGLGSLFVAGTF